MTCYHEPNGFFFDRHRVSRIRRTKMGVRIVLAQGESIGQALKRFRKLLERHGMSWELKRRKYFVKPSQVRRSKRFRKRFKARRAVLLAKMAGEQSRSSLADSVKAFWRNTGKP